MAFDDGVSLNQYITNAVNREVSGEEVGKQFGEVRKKGRKTAQIT